ncbi:MAG TPA: 23S rRNA (pseudouridine(1915)-N(3))-methyltransferase RlmH [Polyangiaceae bacterium]|nr:23S rRNA (pseudouridine(1915)-N(3))-methyltransferase RlmH [Polyangiaceae bacterium]
MRIVVIAQGKLKERGLREVADDYLTRIRKHVRCEEIEVRKASELAARVPKDATVVALEVNGDRVTSSELSQRLSLWLSRDKGSVAFLIGGSEGLPEELSRSARVRLSLSTLTLPHRLARLLLLEQIYRGLSIARGEPYARED